MKRFTCTEKWRKVWFRKLPPRLKCFLYYFWDNCDCAGVWEPDFEMASIFIGETVSESEVLLILRDRVVILPDGKWWLKGFIAFQYGTLSAACKPHFRIFDSLNRNNLHSLYKGYSKGLESLQEEEEDKDKEEDKEKDKGEGEGVARRKRVAEALLAYLNSSTSRSFEKCESNLGLIRRALGECKDDEPGCIQMIDRQVKRWKNTEFEQYLHPSTLFCSKKFRKYYDDRNERIYESSDGNNGVNGRKPTVAEDRNSRIIGAEATKRAILERHAKPGPKPWDDLVSPPTIST